MKCSECGAAFLNYHTELDQSDAHPEVGASPTVRSCPECGVELSREYVERDPRS